MATKPRSARRPILSRIVGLGLAASILTVSGAGYVAAVNLTDRIRHTEVFAPLTDRPAEAGGTNILVVGSDNREGMSGAMRRKLKAGSGDYGRHTDTMMIAHVADDGSVGFVSIPRDSYVDIPAYTTSSGRTISASKQKINAAYDIGGPTLVVETVEQATGVRIDHYAELNFLGFVSMVDAVGGVPVTTKSAIKDEKSGLDIPAGTTNLDGAQSLAFVRARYFDPTGDLGRMKRQQEFMGALFDKATSPAVLTNPAKLIGLADAAASSLTVDENFDRRSMWNLIASTRVGSTKDVSFQTIPVSGDTMKPGVGSVILWDESAARDLFALLNSGASLSKEGGDSRPVVEVAPASISVQVYNGSGVSGLASKAANDLAAAGYTVRGPAQNAKTQGAADTIIQYDPRYDVSLKTLEEALPGARTEEVANLGRTFKIVVGSSYSGVRSVRTPG